MHGSSKFSMFLATYRRRDEKLSGLCDKVGKPLLRQIKPALRDAFCRRCFCPAHIVDFAFKSAPMKQGLLRADATENTLLIPSLKLTTLVAGAAYRLNMFILLFRLRVCMPIALIFLSRLMILYLI